MGERKKDNHLDMGNKLSLKLYKQDEPRYSLASKTRSSFICRFAGQTDVRKGNGISEAVCYRDAQRTPINVYYILI